MQPSRPRCGMPNAASWAWSTIIAVRSPTCIEPPGLGLPGWTVPVPQVAGPSVMFTTAADGAGGGRLAVRYCPFGGLKRAVWPCGMGCIGVPSGSHGHLPGPQRVARMGVCALPRAKKLYAVHAPAAVRLCRLPAVGRRPGGAGALAASCRGAAAAATQHRAGRHPPPKPSLNDIKNHELYRHSCTSRRPGV